MSNFAPENGPSFIRTCIETLGGASPSSDTSENELCEMLLYEIDRVVAAQTKFGDQPPLDVQYLHSEIAMLRGQVQRSRALLHKLLDFFVDAA